MLVGLGRSPVSVLSHLISLQAPCGLVGDILFGRGRSPEAQASRFLERERVADRCLARAIGLLARVINPKRHDLAMIDYKSLVDDPI